MTPSDNSLTISPHTCNLALLHSTLLHSYPVPLNSTVERCGHTVWQQGDTQCDSGGDTYTVWRQGDSQCDNRVIHSVATWWYTMWQHGDTHRSNMVRTQCDDCVDFAHFHSGEQYFHSVDTQCNTLCSELWIHSVDTVIHRVFTQFHSVKMGQIHAVVIVWTQCGPHCDWLCVFSGSV